MLNKRQLSDILAALKNIIDTEINSEDFQELIKATPELVADFHNPDSMFLFIKQSCKNERITKETEQEACELLIRVLSQVSQKSYKYLATQSPLITVPQDFIAIFTSLDSPQQLFATYRTYKSKLLSFTEKLEDLAAIMTLFSNKYKEASNERTKYYIKWMRSNFCNAQELSAWLFLIKNPNDYLLITPYISSALKKEFAQLTTLSVKLFLSIYQELRDTQTSLFKTNQWPASLPLDDIDNLVLMTQIISRAEKNPNSRTSDALNLLKLYHNARSNSDDALESIEYLSRETMRIGRNRSSFWKTTTNEAIDIKTSPTYNRLLGCLS